MKFQYSDTCLLKNSEITDTAKTIVSYISHLQQVVQDKKYDTNEGSINLPSDDKIVNTVKKTVKKHADSNLRYIIDIGIGGSNLGTKAVYDALFGYFDVIEPNRFPKIIFMDTNDPEFTEKLINLLETLKSEKEFIVNMISKSGSTTETVANFETVFTSLQKQFSESGKRVVITTDENSKLYVLAQEKNITVLTLPKLVGGRYSVFSNVGLFPLAAAGVDIDQLREGARMMRTQCLSSDILENPALISATILYLHSKSGKNINDNFFFHPELESIGKWYRQLMGESIGKDQDLEGKSKRTGITPTVSIGSTDLHSVGQLYFGGPRDKISTFISAKSNKDVCVPKLMNFSTLIPHIAGKSFASIIDAIKQGTATAYQNQRLPFMQVELDTLGESALGEYLQFKMIEMMYLAQLLHINAFDQPHVELYKAETKKILTQ